MFYDKLAINRIEVPEKHQRRERVASPHRHRWYLPAKYAAEWLVALVLLVLASPLIALMALLTKLTSRGPAFYTQVRSGKNGQSFVMCKIRTMAHNCEAQTGPVWSSGDDARITAIGRFLRETHLDELPQLIHVLQGHMSLIGPRPERPEIIERIERSLPRYHERLLVRPGLSGLAQVQRPADADLEDVRHKLVYDLYYIRQMSPWLDVRIVLATVFQMAGMALHAAGKVLVRADGDAANSLIEEVPLLPDDEDRRAEVA